jgi:Fe-S oxidoreductase
MKIKYSDAYSSKIKEITKNCYGNGCCKCLNKCSLIKMSPIEYSKQTDLLNVINGSGGGNSSISIDNAFLCTQCGLCESVCPVSVGMNKIFLEQRKEFFRKNNYFNRFKKFRSIKTHQKLSFSKFFTAKSIPAVKSKIVFLPGCSLSSYNPLLVMEVYRFLKLRIPEIGIVLKCCGSPTHLIGDELRHDQYYASFIREIEDNNISEIITSCPSCHKIISDHSPHIKVRTIWELLVEIGIPETKLQIPDSLELILHDPCPTRNNRFMHEDVRKLLEMADIKTKEFNHSRQNTRCCGVGGMVGATNPSVAIANIKQRIDEVPSDVIITYCASCVDAFRSADKEAYHILELLFDSNSKIGMNNTIPSYSTVTKWLNRAKCKSMIENLTNQGESNV